jgi:Spy/CpxP family protein refolding chaperone
MLDHVLDQVDATALQRTQVHQIVESTAAALASQRAAGRADHEQMAQLFTQPVVDAAAVEAVRQRMVQRQDEASRRMVQAMLDVSNVLSATQRQQLQAAMRELRERHRPPRPEAGASDAAPPQ